MDHKIDVLNVEITSNASRDRIMVSLVCNYLRFCGYKVVEGHILSGRRLLNKYKPKVLFISSSIGAMQKLNIVKYAKSKDIKVVSLTSEGNFKDDSKSIEQFVWGWNKDKTMHEDCTIYWTERTRNLALGKYPFLSDKIKVSGATGFDIYKIKPPVNKRTFLKKYNKDYSKVIGVGCWDFNVVYEYDHRFTAFTKNLTRQQIDRFRKDGADFNSILIEVIKAFPDVLFLLKEHPLNVYGGLGSAIQNTDKFDNVLILKDEEAIYDCISVSDFWLTYESTTAVEAWLMDKKTALLNPSGTDFPRANVYTGSPNYQNKEQLINAISIFYTDRDLPGYHKLEHERKRIIVDTIQWDDGHNHVRAGNIIIDILGNAGDFDIKKDSLGVLYKRLKLAILKKIAPTLRFIPFFENYTKMIRRFDYKELYKVTKELEKIQFEYYSKNHLTKEKLGSYRGT
ncbi:MAG: hypothetical protein AMS26_04480 [Bacteroides sp. SM23_62]|nr:MAG: hypothetical protein AMS26_04480 [Bacteroides sp. SM23_62]